MEKLVLIGAGGHCKAVADILDGMYEIIGVTDINETKKGSKFYGIDIIGNDEKLRYIYHDGVTNALVTVGSVKDNSKREQLFNLARDIGFNMINAISRNAIVAKSVIMGSGNVVMDGAIIHADASLGNNSIINTASIIEHDCTIGDHVHLSVGARLAGGVKLGSGSMIGMGASIIQGIEIGSNCIIGAGTVVIRNVPDNSVCAGVPGRIIKSGS